MDDANSNLAIFPRGYQGVRHKNLAREETPPTESVQIIDPKDLAT
jgi:hypothetical protein